MVRHRRGLALAVLLLGPPACRSEQPAPTRVDPAAKAEEAEARGPRPLRADRDQPPPRSAAQLADEELEHVLAAAERLMSEGKEVEAQVELRRCSNRVPVSGRCEMRLAQLLGKLKNRKGELHYYLREALAARDPEATPAQWREFAETAARAASYEIASEALRELVARGAATPADHVELSHALQAMRDHLPEAIAALERAVAAEDADPEWVQELAVLEAQTGKAGRAAELLETYLERTRGRDPTRDAAIRERIAELRSATAKAPPPG